MAELDDGEKYTTEEQPWWANDYLIFLLTIANIAIIVYDLEYFSERTIFDIIEDKDLKWMFLALSDLLLICIFLADLRDDYERCVDKEWWWKTPWINSNVCNCNPTSCISWRFEITSFS